MAWHQTVTGILGDFPSSNFPQLVNPIEDGIPADAESTDITWAAFPARLAKKNLPDEVRWRLADENRSEQDEYCEWSVKRDPLSNKIVRVTFTCELPEYFDRLADDDELLVALYGKHVDEEVEPEQLRLPNGKYMRGNQWNDSSTDGNIMHLMQASNKLTAAVALVAEATILREKADGVLVTDRDELYECAGTALGNKDRNSDPQIAEKINGIARQRKRVTFADPIGLYIDELITANVEFPEGLTLDDCWRIERGDPEHILRARFELPEGQTLNSVTIDERPITRGAQIADRVMVRITGLADRIGTTEPVIEPCGV